jgi:hypothetical protein
MTAIAWSRAITCFSTDAFCASCGGATGRRCRLLPRDATDHRAGGTWHTGMHLRGLPWQRFYPCAVLILAFISCRLHRRRANRGAALLLPMRAHATDISCFRRSALRRACRRCVALPTEREGAAWRRRDTVHHRSDNRESVCCHATYIGRQKNTRKSPGVRTSKNNIPCTSSEEPVLVNRATTRCHGGQRGRFSRGAHPGAGSCRC